MLHRKIRYEQAKNVLCFLNIFKHLLYNFASVFDQCGLHCSVKQHNLGIFQNKWCSTKKAWVTSERMKLPSRPVDEKIPRNVGNCRKCLVVNATSHANYLGLEARHFPLCFVTAPLWGAMWVPSNEQLCNRPPGRGQFPLRAACLLC